MTESQAVAIQPSSLTDLACSTQDVLRAAALIQQIMGAVMKDGEHYGVIPGTSGKRSLFKSGAEKLCFTFGLSNKLEIKSESLPGGHREYTIVCNLFDRAGNLRGQGVGSASTMESKHRYRGAGGKVCPSCSALAVRASKKEYGGGYYCDGKAGGCGWKTKAGTAEALALDAVPTTKNENPDPADQYNTVLKMAKKRALVDAVLTATAASDCFAQDLEDLEDSIDRADARDAASHPAAPQTARTAPAGAQAEAPPPADAVPAAGAKAAAGEPTALAAGRDLMGALVTAKQDGRKILGRLSMLHGGKAPKDIPADRLDAFAEDVATIKAAIADPDKVEETISEWERQAVANGGGK